jgi:hypothetical protein
MKLWSFLYLISALKSLIPDIHDQQKKTHGCQNMMSIIILGIPLNTVDIWVVHVGKDSHISH